MSLVLTDGSLLFSYGSLFLINNFWRSRVYEDIDGC